jgi:hypothetical protein
MGIIHVKIMVLVYRMVRVRVEMDLQEHIVN